MVSIQKRKRMLLFCKIRYVKSLKNMILIRCSIHLNREMTGKIAYNILLAGYSNIPAVPLSGNLIDDF